MTLLGPEKVGFFVRQHRDELTRIWRLARANARPDVFPGLIDGVVGAFFDTCADLLSDGRSPDEVWHALSGLIRWPPALAPAELEAEWRVLEEVLAAACEAVNCQRDVSEWLKRATGVCQAGTAALGSARDQPPAGIVTAMIYSPLAPRHVGPERGTNA